MKSSSFQKQEELLFSSPPGMAIVSQFPDMSAIRQSNTCSNERKLKEPESSSFVAIKVSYETNIKDL